ncbi:uncharacterized protein LOC128569958 isoform X2 [Nycticebus coucang]|uniref:uncharacterized protein LOC128569958 isoform X2 n=1 Tax=Nycticebus coucang TaxID=9470 RepID=UPI00234D36A9|nr:uncharacterized protein LOC128569958 isoform X2 [Nycticebus coucang]
MVETNPSWCPVLRKVDLSGLSLRTRPNLINSTFRILAWCHTCTLTLPLRGEPGPSELNRSSQESPAPWMGQLLLQAAAWTQISSPQADKNRKDPHQWAPEPPGRMLSPHRCTQMGKRTSEVSLHHFSRWDQLLRQVLVCALAQEDAVGVEAAARGRTGKAEVDKRLCHLS